MRSSDNSEDHLYCTTHCDRDSTTRKNKIIKLCEESCIACHLGREMSWFAWLWKKQPGKSVSSAKTNVVIQNDQTTSKIDDDFHWKELAYLYKNNQHTNLHET
jgi:hypothetical protein